MSRSTAPILLLGAATMGGDILVDGTVDWRVPLMTGVATLIGRGLELFTPLAPFVAGVAWVALLTSALVERGALHRIIQFVGSSHARS